MHALSVFRRPLLNRLSRRTGVPLRIRPLRHRRQSAQEQQQPRQRMDVRLPQRPDRRYRHLQYDSYDPLAKVRNWITADGESRQQTHYFHCDQIGIPREMTDKDSKLLWFGNYTGWGRLKEETKVLLAHTNPSASKTSIATVKRA